LLIFYLLVPGFPVGEEQLEQLLRLLQAMLLLTFYLLVLEIPVGEEQLKQLLKLWQAFLPVSFLPSSPRVSSR
jgi:hypothetical protein